MTTQLTVALLPAHTKSKNIGWLIYHPVTKEYVCTHQHKPNSHTTTYTKDASLAHCYASSFLAINDSLHIDVITEVVPAFEVGDKIVANIPDNYYGCVCIITQQQAFK